MFTQREIDAYREDFEAEFNCVVRITRGTNQDAQIDPETLQMVDDPRNILYDDLEAFIAPTTRNYERAFEIGQARQMSRTYNVRVPWHVDNLKPNDAVKIIDIMDPLLQDKTVILLDPQGSSQNISRNFVAELDLGS